MFNRNILNLKEADIRKIRIVCPHCHKWNFEVAFIYHFNKEKIRTTCTNCEQESEWKTYVSLTPIAKKDK